MHPARRFLPNLAASCAPVPALVRALAAALAGLPCFAAVPAGAQDIGEQLESRLVAQRQRCAGGRAPALASDARLDRAARRSAAGEPVLPAARAEGLRATRAVQLRLSGVGDAAAVAAFVGEKYCNVIGDAALRAFGVHREGRNWWLVIAAPQELPDRDEAAQVAQRVLALTNEARGQARRCGDRPFNPAPPLRANALLERAAAAHADDMARHEYLEHQGRDGAHVGDRATRAGYRWRAVGENIASGQGSAELVVRDWLRSPQHCAGIMNPAFTEMGVAHALNVRGEAGIYWAQVFGTPR